MKKLQLFISAILISFPTFSHAQNNITKDTDIEVIETEEDEEETNADETDNSNDIEMPEAMTTKVDSLLHLYNNQTYLKPDVDCDFPDVNPTYEPEVYMERLRKLPNIIEMPYNQIVQRFIDSYSGRLRQSVSIMLGASNFYMPIFEQALESYDLPLELKYLPVIESALNPNAISRAGATGLWQFMVKTAKTYGLEVNTLIDERRDPIKASYAAAHYLSDLYKIFGDWSLVIASYNCGPENVSKAIHRAGGVKDYWEIYSYLPRETRGYVPAFIAANYIMNYYCEHNICPMSTTLPAHTDTIMVDKDLHFSQIANVLGVNEREIATLNPQYRRNIINGNSQPSILRLKTQDIISFIDQKDSVFAYKADVLLAKRDIVEVDETKAAPVKTVSKRSNSRRSSRSRARTTTIRKGDTLSQIAKRNGTTVAKLRRLNPSIKGSHIRAGKKLRIR
jgi:membrane-bound lytic murein transglycosylase D